jgi:hypothetical protein
MTVRHCSHSSDQPTRPLHQHESGVKGTQPLLVAPKQLGNCNGPPGGSIHNGAQIRFVMFETESKCAADPRFVRSRNTVETILASATEAFGSAFLVWMMGGVAISIAGSFADKMVPSLPPGFDGAQAGHHQALWHAVRGGAFGFFFAIFFIHSLWEGFHGDGGGAGRRIERILSHLRENWFSLIVGNAIGAWVAVLVLGIVPRFSLLQMLLHWVWRMVLPVVQEIGLFVLGASNTAGLSDWFSWYNVNQMKLNFWILYLGGAFDDLGVPNFKTLARWAWRRMQKRQRATLPASVGRVDSTPAGWF